MKPSMQGTMPALPPLVVDRKLAAARSVAWRTSQDPQITRRRKVIARTAVATASMGLASLYQTGILRKLPDLPFAPFNAEHVESSAEGYQVLGVPDAVLAVFSNATTITLAVLGGPGPRSRPLRALLAAKVSLDSAYISKLVFDQATQHKTYCWQCLLAAAATWASLPPAWRDAA